MTIQEIFSESFYIEMSLSNLDICNEGITEVAVNVCAAVVRMIEKFIGWVKNTVMPFLKRIGEVIANLLRKTKLGRKILGPKKVDTDADLNDDADESAAMAKMKREVLVTPRWLNKIAHSYINPNNIMKIANSTEDRTDDINIIEARINDSLAAGNKVQSVQGLESAMSIAREQLEILEKSVAVFESNSSEIIKKCEELKRKLQGSSEQGSARVKNATAIIQLMTKKTAEAIKLSSENVAMLQKVVDPFKK